MFSFLGIGSRKRDYSHAGVRHARSRRLRVERLEERLCLSHPAVGPTEFIYGVPGDVPLMGDWDGDGVETPGIFRDGTFHLRNSTSEGVGEVTFNYGRPGDVPIAGDWDGDGIDTVGVVRDNVWHLRNSNTTGFGENIFIYGLKDDEPIVGDWDGDGVDTPGVVRRRGGSWHLRNSNDTGVGDIAFIYNPVTPSFILHSVGLPPRLAGAPVVGDWDGDGLETVGVFASGEWYIRSNNTAPITLIGLNYPTFLFGSAEGLPVVADAMVGTVHGNEWTLIDVDDDIIVHSQPPQHGIERILL